jgi:hypothetical protein
MGSWWFRCRSGSGIRRGRSRSTTGRPGPPVGIGAATRCAQTVGLRSRGARPTGGSHIDSTIADRSRASTAKHLGAAAGRRTAGPGLVRRAASRVGSGTSWDTRRLIWWSSQPAACGRAYDLPRAWPCAAISTPCGAWVSARPCLPSDLGWASRSRAALVYAMITFHLQEIMHAQP